MRTRGQKKFDRLWQAKETARARYLVAIPDTKAEKQAFAAYERAVGRYQDYSKTFR